MLVGQITAGGAVLDVFPHRSDGPREMNAVFNGALDKVKNESQRCFFADSGQGSESVDGFFDQL